VRPDDLDLFLATVVSFSRAISATTNTSSSVVAFGFPGLVEREKLADRNAVHRPYHRGVAFDSAQCDRCIAYDGPIERV
jgi:hypothetical protein